MSGARLRYRFQRKEEEKSHFSITQGKPSIPRYSCVPSEKNSEVDSMTIEDSSSVGGFSPQELEDVEVQV